MPPKPTKKNVKKRGRVNSFTLAAYRSLFIGGFILTFAGLWWLSRAPVSVYLYDAGVQASQRAGLAIHNLKLYGHYYTTERNLRDQLDVSEGDSMFLLSPTAATSRIAALPWVDSVEIRRVFPHDLYVFVREKKPAAIWLNPKGEAILVDKSGQIIAPKTAGGHEYLLRIRGEGAKTHLEPLMLLLEDRHYLKQNVNMADFVGERRWDLLLNNQTRILLPQKDMEQALNQLDTYLQNDNLIDRGVKTIDLRLPTKIIVEP